MALRRHAGRGAPDAQLQTIELMTDAPNMLTRPLMLIDSHAYASTWLWTKATTSADTGQRVTQARRHFIVRDDGVLFGEVGDRPMRDLGLEMVVLDSSHPDELVWSVQGVSRYRDGGRRNPVETFAEVAGIFDHFMDFRGSLAPQAEMCELSACLSLMTWLADAFTVLPYPWTTSPGAGSGKSNWGLCWVKTSYLGYPTTMGGTFSALRDLAEMGATLLFDDAELLSDLDAVDPDKRELVLAGNRKGVKIPVKEPVPGGGWRLRWMNAYCPRGFTAIRLPSGPLESRCIVIPLLKTADPQRGNCDPADEAIWPVPRRQLIDHLWMLATALLPQAAQCWNAIGAERELIGRSFEPWRAVMAVARLMEQQGCDGLERRMRAVMRSYQTQKQGFIAADQITFILRGVLTLLRDVDDVSDVVTFLGRSAKDFFSFKTSDLVAKVTGLAEEADVKLDLGESPGRTIGQTLRKLGFTKDDERKARGWKITGSDLTLLVRGYGVLANDEKFSGDVSQENVETS
jgi:hypothetical protein